MLTLDPPDRAGTPSGRLDEQLAIAEAARDRGDYPAGIAAAERAAELADACADNPRLAAALQLLAAQQARVGQQESAATTVERALLVTRTLGDDTRTCDLLVSQAMALSDLGLNTEAMTALAEAHALANRLDDRWLLFWVGNRTGSVQCALGEHERALETMGRALPLSEGLGLEATFCINTNLVDCALRLVPHRRREGDEAGADAAVADAVRHARLALELGRAADNTYREALALCNLGKILGLAGDIHGGREALDVARQLATAFGYRTLDAVIDQHLGEVELLAGNPDAAVELLDRALVVAGKLSEQAVQLDALRALCEAHEKAGELRAALDRLRELHRLERTLQSEAAATRLRLLEHQEQLEGAMRDTAQARRQSEEHRVRSQELEADKRALLKRTRELHQSARRDPLTGVGNRLLLEQELPDLVERAALEHRTLSFAMIDIDHFKRVNDTYGHPAGDVVLVRVAGMLLAASRESDAVVRLGGEEFLMVFTDTDLPAALIVAERLRHNIAGLSWPDLGASVRVTVSIGVSTLDETADVAGLVALADAALYRAKTGGRNRVLASADQLSSAPAPVPAPGG